MIRNVVFDMGNVLLRFDPEMFMTREGVTDPEDRRLMQKYLFRSLEWQKTDWGILDEAGAEASILPKLPERLRAPMHRMLFGWDEPVVQIEGMLPLVKRLRQAGYHIYLLSNASVRQPAYWVKSGYAEEFEGALVSAFEHVVKPMPEIYQAFTRKFQLEPEECVFVDDAPQNVQGAVCCRWQGVIFNGNAAELEEDLKKLGLNF